MGRTTYKLSQEGLEEIEEKRQLKGWNRTSKRWARMADSSESTLKRFLRGEAISAEHFMNLCKAVGIEDWQSLVDWKSVDRDSTRVTSKLYSKSLSQSETERQKTKYSLTVTGIFTEDQKLQIEGILEALKKLLSNTDIVFKSQNDISNKNDDL
ncbi:MAG: hypothetical protein AAFV71_05460 [Cyanobacteria bacterium J06633_8]